MRWEAHQRRGIRRGEQKLGGGRGGVALSPASICPHKNRPNAGEVLRLAGEAGGRSLRSDLLPPRGGREPHKESHTMHEKEPGHS